MANDLLYFNGVNGATGEYGLPPMSGEELSKFIQGEAEPSNLGELRWRHQQKDQKNLGVKEGVDPKKLEEAGWGVIFAHDADLALKEALDPLLQLRREQAGETYRLYEKGNGFRVGRDTKGSFLARHGAGPGPADPETVPYYLLMVGGPEQIPYRFQSQLDVQYAVGRIDFGDDLDAYDIYARSVVEAESGRVKLGREVSFFGVANNDDRATQLSADHLVSPLVEHLTGKQDWTVNAFLKDEAGKSQLARLLGGDQTPALLFTAGHGMEFPLGDPRQLPHQGALLCQDWPGPRAWQGRGAIPQDFYFAGDDLPGTANLLGLMGFFFACYGGGTPKFDDFAKQAFKDRRAKIAPHAFLAGLPTRMLSNPGGGALAVIGHVERAWGYSFLWNGAGPQTTVFESTLDRLLKGHPVGSAVEYLNERYAELSTVLADEVEEIEFGKQVDPYELAGMWTANNDARGYTIVGDPAVRLPVVEADEAPLERPVIEVKPVTPPPPSSRGVPSPPAVVPPPPSKGVSPPPATPSEPPATTPPLPAPSMAIPEPASAVDFSPSAAPADEVHFRAYHPPSIRMGERRKLLVYAHLVTALADVERDARQVLGQALKAYRQAEAEASLPIAPGTEITLVPQAVGLEFNPPQARLTWSNRWQRTDFEMQATGERIGHVIEGAIACYVGPLLVADIRLPVVVPKPQETVEAASTDLVPQSARMYRAVFASYSHADTTIVEAVETAYKALGMDYLRDVMDLKAGQRWSDQLLSFIEQADIFQLFWSSTAEHSSYVQQEWLHALNLLERKGPAFIRPVYWEQPMPPVPEELSFIHFAPVDFSFVASHDPVVETNKPAPSPPPAVSSLTSPLLDSLLPTVESDLKRLTVSTYTAADPANPADATLRARTRLSLDGDVEVYLADEAAESKEVLDLHTRMVKEAVAARLAYLELMARLIESG